MRLLRTTLAVLAFGLSCPFLFSQPNDWHSDASLEATYHFDEAVAHHDAGEFTQASVAYQLALRQNPERTDAWFNLALVHFHMGDLMMAERYLDTLFILDPMDAEAYGLYGLTLYNRGQFDRAVTAFNFAILTNPSEDLYIARGLAYLAGGHLHRASLDFDLVLKADPGNFRACQGKGAALLQMENYHLAIRYFNRMLNFNPEHAGALTNRAICYFRQGEKNKAMADFELAMQLGSKSETWLARADCRILEGDLQGALADVRVALRLDPVDEEVYSTLGEVELAMGKYAAAAESFSIAIELNLYEASNFLQRGTALALQGHFEEAVNDVYSALEMGLPDEDGRETLQWIYRKMDEAHLTQVNAAY